MEGYSDSQLVVPPHYKDELTGSTTSSSQSSPAIMDNNHDQSTWVEEETSPYSYPKAANIVNQSMTPQMDSSQRSASGADFFDSFQPDAAVQVSYSLTIQSPIS